MTPSSEYLSQKHDDLAAIRFCRLYPFWRTVSLRGPLSSNYGWKEILDCRTCELECSSKQTQKLCRCNYTFVFIYIERRIHSFIHTISIAPFQVHYYSEALPTQNGYYAGISRRSATGNWEWRTCPRSLYVVARAGVEPMTLRTKGVDSTNAPHTPHAYRALLSKSLTPPSCISSEWNLVFSIFVVIIIGLNIIIVIIVTVIVAIIQ